MIWSVILGFLKSAMEFIITYWKQIAAVLLFMTAIYFVHNNGYNKAYAERTDHYEKILAEMHNGLEKKIDGIEKSSSELTKQNIENGKKLDTDLSKILTSIKGKPLFTLKNGECTPSKDFIDSYNSIIFRGNAK